MDLKLSRSFITSILFLAGAALFLMALVQPVAVQACQHDSTDPAGSTEFRIIVGPLRIRDAPNGNIIGVLLIGQTITVTEYVQADIYLWGRHALGWSALHTVDCTREYAEPPAAGDAAPEDVTGSDETSPADAPGAASPSAPALSGSDNLCHTVWTFCNTGTPEQQAYFWRLGWFASAIERGEVPPGSPEEYASGEVSPEPISPEATAEP